MPLLVKFPRLHRLIPPTLAVLCLTAASVPLAADISELPDLGDASATIISPAEERELGENFMRTARAQFEFVDDPALNDYLQSLGTALARHSDGGQPFRFFLINDPSLNAFAVPGGFVGVHTGLVLATETEGELASVLAHESAHVTQRHLPRMMARAKERSLPTMAALIAAIMLGGQAGEAAIAVTSAANVSDQLSYTRDYEREADRLGMRILQQSGYNPRAMPAFFERLQSSSRIYDFGVPEFLRTHPITSDRIAEAKNRAAQYPDKGRRDSDEFQHFRAAARVLSTDAEQAVTYFRETLDSGQAGTAGPNALRYGYAYALLRARRYPEARREIERLRGQAPRNVSYLLLAAAIDVGGGRYSQGLALYADAHRIKPTPAVTRYYAAALLKTGHAARAKTLLEKTLKGRRDDPELYKLLAEAAGETGDRVAAHRALSEYYYLNGNAYAAIDQLQIARRYTQGDYYAQAGIEARIREIKDERERFGQAPR